MKRFVDELRDPFAVGMALAAGVLSYAFGADLGQALAAGIAVMLVRVAAGLWRPPPIPDRVADPEALTSTQREIAKLIGWGNTNEHVAAQRKLSLARVAEHIEQILKKTGYKTREELALWARAVWPPITPVDKIPPDKPLIRMVLMFASFLSLGWTSYQIYIQVLRLPICQRFGICS